MTRVTETNKTNMMIEIEMLMVLGVQEVIKMVAIKEEAEEVGVADTMEIVDRIIQVVTR